jgi:hypothetical protein
VTVSSLSPDCDLPQEPSPIDIVYYAPDESYIVLPLADWAKLGGYVYDLRAWIRSAGPCLVHKPAQPPWRVGK